MSLNPHWIHQQHVCNLKVVDFSFTDKMAAIENKNEPVIPGACADCHDYEHLHSTFYAPKDQYKEGYVLLTACKNGHLDCIKACLAAGVDVNVKFGDKKFRKRPLGEAVGWYSHVDCVEYLIKAGAQICDEVLCNAGRSGSKRCVNLILDAGGDINTVLCYASGCGLENIVEYFIQRGADVNKSEALACAAIDNSVECVNLLLQAGADVNALDQDGRTLVLMQ